MRYPARTSLVLLVALLLAMAGCTAATSEPSDAERGHDPWVFRSVLDWQPRIITFALSDNFWVAYHAERASLYKVWRDGVEFDGTVYTTAHGPQPISLGDAYLVSPYREPWRVLREGSATEVDVQYRGHRYEGDHAMLMYTLRTDDGTEIEVTETPEYMEDDEGHPGLERTFVISGVPEGAQVALDIHLNSLAAEDSYETDGTFEPEGVETSFVQGRLVLQSNATTHFTVFFDEEPRVLAEEVKPDADKHPGELLIARSDCHACHNAEVQTVGPAYVSIAERYEANSENVGMLASKIIQGGTGAWSEQVGEAVMTPHPDLQPADAEQMVRFILAMDGEAEVEEEPAENPMANKGPSFSLFEPPADTSNHQGLVVNIYQYPTLTTMPEPSANELPVYSGVVPTLHQPTVAAFGELTEHFYVHATGFIDIPRTTNYVFRLVSDDGGILYIDDKVVVNHDGLHGPDPKDGEVYLEEGVHPLELRFFQSGGGMALSLQWIAHGEDDFSVIPTEALSFDPADLKEARPYTPPEPIIEGIPGDAHALIDVHPSFSVETIRPDDFEPKVAGLDILPDGRIVLSTWDAAGSVYIIDNLDAEDRNDIEVTRIAKGLLEPLGLRVVDGEIYVLQKHELTHLVDHDGDGMIDEYRTVADDWGVTPNFHEFAFGLAYQDGYFYATLATAILPGGASAQPQNPDRGKVVKISKEDGSVEFIASGLRTPNGIGEGVDGELFVADNQGDWLPSSKIVHVQPGAWYGSRSVDFEGTANLKETQPVVWLPQDEIGNSPSQPAPLNVGPYENQMIHGEVTHGGLKRVFVEQVNGQYQGAVFRFTQGLEAGVNRIMWGPDDKLYIGGIGNPGNWSHYGTNWFGLQRFTYTGNPVFEMLAVQARQNGFEIEFTEPLPVDDGFEPEDYLVQQWWYEPTAEYGGPKKDVEMLPLHSVQVSEDRKRVFLELGGMKPGHVVYIRIMVPLISSEGHELWSTESWYTLNQIPQETGATFTATATSQDAGPNTLTQAEQDAGWRLLFDGETLNGWHTYGQDTVGEAWKVEDGTFLLDDTRTDSSGQVIGGGDIVTDEAFENYELELEWKIEPGGNSGIIYNVQESDEYAYSFQTGPEMQILDNDAHADGLIFKHRAGDLYDLIPSRFVATRLVGEWNHVRLIQRDGHVEHWLNGHKLLEAQIGSPEWNDLVAGSKFSEMPAFGKATQGRIALQDHGNRIWFRNVKIRSL